jgi:hypothetical protein
MKNPIFPFKKDNLLSPLSVLKFMQNDFPKLDTGFIYKYKKSDDEVKFSNRNLYTNKNFINSKNMLGRCFVINSFTINNSNLKFYEEDTQPIFIIPVNPTNEEIDMWTKRGIIIITDKNVIFYGCHTNYKCYNELENVNICRPIKSIDEQYIIREIIYFLKKMQGAFNVSVIPRFIRSETAIKEIRLI